MSKYIESIKSKVLRIGRRQDMMLPQAKEEIEMIFNKGLVVAKERLEKMIAKKSSEKAILKQQEIIKNITLSKARVK